MRNVLTLLANKYVITLLAFAVWCLFFDQNDWFSVRQKQRELDKLKGNIAYLNKEIESMNTEREALTHDSALIEKYAREIYHMKRDNEDVYMVDSK